MRSRWSGIFVRILCSSLWLGLGSATGGLFAQTPPPPGDQPPPPSPAAPAPPPAEGPAAAELAQGLELLRQGNLDDAERHLAKVIALDPQNQVACSRLAYVRFRKADYAGAAKHAEVATKVDPTDSLAFLLIGRSREAMGDAAGAVAAYASAAETTAKAKTQDQLLAGALGHYLKGLHEILEGHYDRAEPDIKEAADLYPKNAYILYERGLVLVKTGKPQEAIEALKSAADLCAGFQAQETWIYPNRRYFFICENIQYWHGVALRQAGRLDEATATLEGILPKVEALAGSTTTPQLSRAALNLDGRLDRSFLGSHYELALTDEAKGKNDEALALLKRFLKLNLGNPELVQQVKELQKRLK